MELSKLNGNDPNIAFISAELNWFTEVINTRLKTYFDHDTGIKKIADLTLPPVLKESGNAYSDFIKTNKLTFEDRICLILSLIPYLNPQILDCFNIKNADTDQRFTEFGCIRGTNHNGLLPTLETLIFILAADDLQKRIYYIDYFGPRHDLFKKKYITLDFGHNFEPFQSAVMVPSAELTEMLLKGKEFSPEFSHSFPAKRINTGQTWDELVVDNEILTQINEIKAWIKYGDLMLDSWDLRHKLKAGYRSLFYGPSGTGKTFTATLLGKYTNRDVYRIDLSMVVSKYIGETEKNLAKVFDYAENKNWILFFDEADALFGKRTNIKDAHDRYANQEVSFLLQRIEDYNGLIILASNLKTNIDEAFARRFQSIIHFSVPNSLQREKIWKNAFSEKTVLDPDIEIAEIAEKYELTGGSILNVVRYCSLMAMSRNNNIISSNDIISGIKKEYQKEGKTI